MAETEAASGGASGDETVVQPASAKGVSNRAKWRNPEEKLCMCEKLFASDCFCNAAKAVLTQQIGQSQVDFPRNPRPGIDHRGV